MPYCINCGKFLQEGEVCNCTANAQGAPMQQPNNAAPQGGQPYNGGMQPPPYPYNGQPYPNQPYPNQPNPVPTFNQQLANPPKKSYAWILAIIIPLASVFVLILMAILVPSMLGYTKRSKQSSFNSKANILCKAANTAIVELDEKTKGGINVKGRYIISSDKSKNSGVPFDTGEFYAGLERYFSDVKDYDYFIVFSDGCAEYTALSESWTKKSYVGTYPGGTARNITKYNPDGIGGSAGEKASLYDLYKDALYKLSTYVDKER